MYRLLPGVILMFLLSACVHPAMQSGSATAEDGMPPQAEPDRQTPFARLTVHGEASVEVPPDQLRMRLSVVTSDPDSDRAMAENNRQMTALIEGLVELGLGSDDYQTGQFQTRPEWSRPPRPAPATWKRSIIGYTVVNELLIRTDRIDLAGKLLAAAQAAGANQIGSLNFALTEPAEHREEAIILATRRAKLKAQTLAEAAGVALGPIQALSLDQAAAPGPVPLMEMATAKAATDAVPVNIGNVEVRAGVTIVFRIAEALE